MSRKERGRHDWLSLIRLSGLVLSEPVLDEHFPEGMPPVEGPDLKWFKRHVDRHDLARNTYLARKQRGEDPKKSQQTIRHFVNFVLEIFLDHPLDEWRKSGEIPRQCRKAVPSIQQELRPDRVLMHGDEPVLLVDIVDPNLNLDKRDPAADAGRSPLRPVWSASCARPTTPWDL